MNAAFSADVAGGAPASAAAPAQCIACGAAPRTRYTLANGAPLRQCPVCRLAWWDWPPFDPTQFYDQSYFQGAGVSKGYDDYAALELGVARTARARLARIRSVGPPSPMGAPRSTGSVRPRCLTGEDTAHRAVAQTDAGSVGPPSPMGAPRSTGSVRPLCLTGEDTAQSAVAHADAGSVGPPCPTASGAPDLLELGCGTGVFLSAARNAGWRVSGIEVSAYAAERARQRGLAVETGPVEGRDFGAERYDCVVLWDVIEHLRDPAGVLRAALTALRPGGVLALSTGDITSWCARLSGPRWHLFNLPEHLFFFSRDALTRLIASAGGRVVATKWETNWVPLAYVLERLRKPGGVLAAAARVAERTLGAGAARRVIPANLFDVRGVYAVKG